MICTQCGAFSEDNKKHCPVCGAPLPTKDSTYTPISDEEQQAHNENTDAPAWNFVRSPKWPKPTFDINNVDEQQAQSDAAHDYRNRPDYTPPGSQEGGYEQEAYEQEPRVPRSSVQRAASQYTSAENGAPEDEQSEQPHMPYASVGGYGSNSDGYRGNFGRAPQRAYYDETENGYDAEDSYQEDYADQDDAQPVMPKRGQSFSSSRSRGGSVNKARNRHSSLRGGGKRRNNLLFFGAAGVLVVLLIVFGIIFVNNKYDGLGNFFSSIFGGSPILKDAVMTEGTDENGSEFFLITVYARSGNKVSITVPGLATSTVDIPESNECKLRVMKSLIINQAPPQEEATYTVTPDVKVITPDGDEVPVEVPALTVNVPTLALNVTNPVGTTVQVTRSRVQIDGTVSAQNASITVEGQPLAVDENGVFSGIYELPGTGQYTLNFEAQATGYQITRYSISVDYSVAEADLTFERGTLHADNDKDSITAKGQAPAGSTIALTAPSGVTVDNPNPSVDASGNFSFTATMAEVGSYEVGCAITKDGVTTNAAIIIERAPNLDEYSRKCADPNMALMTGEPSHTAQYLCKGKVVEILQEDPYVIAKVELSNADGAVLFQYHSYKATIEVSDTITYSVFGDYKGIDEETGLPLIYGWFVTKKSS